jgi:mRNA interferase MazF
VRLDVGDIVWIDVADARGTEQAGYRPAIVLSPADYHDVSRRAITCLISSRRRDWPYDLPIPETLRTKGVVLTDQIRAFHIPSRGFRHIETAPVEFVEAVRSLLAELCILPSRATP